MEIDQNRGEMGFLNENGRLPVVIHVCVCRRLFNIPGGAIESNGNTFHQLSPGGHWQ